LARRITFPRGVDARLALPAVAVAVAIVALWWTLLDRIDREGRFLERTTRQHTAVMAHLVEDHAIATFRRLDDLLADVSSHVEKDIPLLVPTRRSFEEGLAASIRIYDANGVLTMALGRSLTRDFVTEQDEFRLHKQGNHTKGIRDGFVIGMPFVSPGTRDVFIPVSRRLDGLDGRFRGVAVADIPAETLARFYGGLDLPQGSTVALTRSDGPILARQTLQEEVVGRSFTNSWVWSEIAKGPVGSARAVSPIDGVERIYAYRLSADYPLLVLVGEATDTVFGPWRHNKFISLAWASVMTAVVLLFTTAFLIELQRRRYGDRALRVRNRAMAWSGDGILIADATLPDMPAVYANPSFEGLMDLPPDGIFDRPVLDILRGRVPDTDTLRSLREDIDAGRDTGVEFQPFGRSDNAEERWLELRASPVLNDEGRLVNLIATVRDISEHKRAQAELAEARREADCANVAKSRFLAAASHDLRQPVQSLLLLMEVLSTRTTDAPTRKVLGTMDRALGALKMLLDGLLDVSRLEAGAVEPARAVFPVNDLLDRIAANSRSVAVRKGLILHIMPCTAHVDSDPMLLGRILQNLVENALRYTETGRILVGCRRRRDTLRIEVWDTGIGIPADRQDEIFQEFVQVENSCRDRDQGLGLGLAVVRRLAKMLGHRVTLHSAPGQGSVFRVEVPLAEPPAVPAPPESPAPSPIPAEPEPPAGGGPAVSITVLVVEDDAIVREGLRIMMEQWGHAVLAAESCAEALGFVAAGRTPDVIVTDYRLADNRTGTEVIREMRRVVGRAVPAILVTGDTAPERLAEAEAGNFRVLHKPVVANELQRAVADALDTTRTAPTPAG